MKVSLKALEDAKARAGEEINRLKSETEGLVKRMVEGAEKERVKILEEIERLKGDREKLRAEKELLECAIKNSLKRPQQPRNSQKTDALSLKSNESPVESLLKRIPALVPLNKRKQ